ncbi:MAG: alpha-glucan family phosphorylase [Rikenellaceae bacterium]
MSSVKLTPDHLFEVSWEVCNKVGGIHTVIATKALTANAKLGDKYILLGPDLSHEGGNQEFEEDTELLKAWRQSLYADGLRVRVGRWKVAGKPIVVLIDFTSIFSRKDEILKALWENYNVDSLSGQWDYVESILFGYVSGMVIASYVDHFCSSTDKVAAHFHEWMTVSGGLYLRKYSPYVATLFTTHATVMGRCIAGNRLPLYNDLEKFNADELARQFNVAAKHSIEKVAAAYHDAFLTVSEITAKECKALLGRDVDCVTPNGFENDFVWEGDEYVAKRAEARSKMIAVAEASLQTKFEGDPLIIGTSGRYEYRNKGIDLFLESLKALAVDPSLKREVLAYITVPAGNYGARNDLKAHMQDPASPIDPSQCKFSTHYLENQQWDPVIKSVSDSILANPDSRVKVIFVPTYLNNLDGLFGLSYYEMLAGIDMTVYPSYYEPWGYTPLESVAFSIPTITTTLAGFGVWVNGIARHDGVEVIKRDDYNDGTVISDVADSIRRFAALSEERIAELRENAKAVANTALWENLFASYEEAYSIALENSIARTKRAIREDVNAYVDMSNAVPHTTVVEAPSWTRMMVERVMPERLHCLEELTRNLWWSWTSGARDLFEYIDVELWAEVEHNPIALLDKLSLQRMLELEKDTKFLGMMDAVYAAFKEYMAEKPEPSMPKIAYFSMEYGLHSSLKIYSGGLGILAGDYLKEASDRNVPMVAVGLLYRYGYFTQKLSSQGAQQATYEAQNFSKLPITPMRDADGNWVKVVVGMPGRKVEAHVWRCQVGRVDLLLLDTDHEGNLPEDKQITHHLYGGDWENRLKQEILLGIGGSRLLRQVGIRQEVYHCNEGHAAFIGVERLRSLVRQKGLNFTEALEVVRSSSLFTTHTPVPAGHDAFPEYMIRQYMSHYPDELGISWDQYVNLGKARHNDPNEKFSMSVLACNLSQEVNGVSWLHGEVSKEILAEMWPGYFKSELHIGYVTNGVHFPTWIASNLRRLYAKHFANGFEGHTYDIPAWQGVHNIPDEELWSARMALKERLINHIRNRYSDPSKVRFDSPSQMVRVQESLDPKILTIGFARRFATYKRAHLLFTNLERLSAIVNNPERPVQFVFAGKAHPNDIPGQDLIKRIVEVSLMPQFLGKIIFLQNYDMELARRMVQGVDVWLNTPTRPLEASGTSGEKCVMNGVLQFSVLDGWYVEGYREGAGWMLPMERTFTDQGHQDELDAEMVYSTIEEEIAPLYYNREAKSDIPRQWVGAVKRCIADIASNFTMNRMIIDYEDRFYNKLAQRKAWIIDGNFDKARQIAAWKRKVSAAWDKIRVVDVKRVNLESEQVYVGASSHFEVTLSLANLSSEDIGVEIVIANQIEYGKSATILESVELIPVASDGNLQTYALDYTPQQTGSFDVAIRVFPKNADLSYRMDFALVKWI